MFPSLKERFTRLLLWSEKYTKTDMVYLSRGGFWSVLGQVTAAVCSLALAIIMSRYVSKDVYGNYKYALAVIGIISIFTLNNLSTAVFQSIARGFDGSLFEGFRINLRWSVLAVCGAIAVAAYYTFEHNFALAFCILVGSCVMPFQNSTNLFISFLSGKRDFARKSLYADVLGNIVPAACMIATAVVWPNLIALVSVYFLSNLAVDFYSYMRIVQIYRPDAQKKDAGMERYGQHLSAMGILGGIAGNIDQVLVFHFVGAIDVAIYTFATGILDQSKGPLKMLDTMMQARFAGRESSDIESGIGNKMLWMLGTGIAAMAIFWFAAPWIYHILFPAYTSSVAYARLYSFNFLGFGTVPVASYLSAHKKVKEQYISNVCGNAALIVFMSVGVIFWGLWGLVAGRVAASIVNALILLILYIHAAGSRG